MFLAVDASVAFKWFVPEHDSEAALALLDGELTLIAPDLIFAEIGNAMWTRLRSVEGGAGAADTAQDALRRILSRTVPAHELVGRAVKLAFELNHPVYDCIYLALCERNAIQLVTADEKFVSRVARTRYSSFIALWA